MKQPIFPAASMLLVLAAMTGVLMVSFSRGPDRSMEDVDWSGYPWLYSRDERPTAGEEDGLSLIIVGDVLLGRGVAGIDDPLGAVSPWLHSADVVVGNLETVIVGDDGIGDDSIGDDSIGDDSIGDDSIGDAGIGAPITPASGPQPIILNSPVTAPETLRQADFNLLSLANNHTLDYGSAGLAETATRLRQAGLLAVGAGPDIDAAYQPQIVSVRGVRLAFLAFNMILPSPPDTDGWARADWDEARAVKAVTAAHAQSDAVIVLMHWGDEYLPLPSVTQKRIGRVLVDAGADLVVGSHPHVIQGTQTIGQHFIAYSLGNFLFDQDTQETTQGLVLRAVVDTQGLRSVQMLPVAAGPSPRLLSAQEAADLLPLIQPPAPRIAFACQPDGCIPAEGPQAAIDGLFWGGQIDLTGDGEPEIVRREKEHVLIYQAGQMVFETSPEWRVVDAALGDPNDDGRYELMLAIWRTDANGVEWSQPYIVGYRGGEYKLLWGGRAVFDPIQEIEVGDVDGDGTDELVVLEQRREGEKAISIWRWREWSFYLVWRSPERHYRDLALVEEPEKLPLISVADTP